MIKALHPSNAITYLGVIIAAIGIANPDWALLCLVAVGMCDLLDGWFARRFERSETTRAIGVQLDSLADVVLFVALPTSILFSLSPQPIFAAAVSAAYALAAISRLAYFNVHADPDGPVAQYRGLPVTFAALVLPSVWLAARLLGLSMLDWAWGVAMLLLAVAFVTDFGVPKPSGKRLPAFGALAVALAAGIIWVQL
jgi:CDP-diacylglycerol--serine O-phosphatidyltransferase